MTFQFNLSVAHQQLKACDQKALTKDDVKTLKEQSTTGSDEQKMWTALETNFDQVAALDGENGSISVTDLNNLALKSEKNFEMNLSDTIDNFDFTNLNCSFTSSTPMGLHGQFDSLIINNQFNELNKQFDQMRNQPMFNIQRNQPMFNIQRNQEMVRLLNDQQRNQQHFGQMNEQVLRQNMGKFEQTYLTH